VREIERSINKCVHLQRYRYRYICIYNNNTSASKYNASNLFPLTSQCRGSPSPCGRACQYIYICVHIYIYIERERDLKIYRYVQICVRV